MDVQEAVENLIASNREGPHWDFKREHHENKAELLHDILCLANSVTKSNKYLIFGVTDPNEGCEIKGVGSNNRRTQNDIIDFLRSKHFAGDIRPEVELQHLSVRGKEIDVLIILDRREKPYYLKQDYRHNGTIVRAHHIYARNIDTNTPIDSSAELLKIEAMWLERFGFDLQPAQRMQDLLRHPEQWEKDIGNNPIAYHRNFPEYQIQFGEPERFTEVYSFFYPNEKSYFKETSFRYLNTELFREQFIYCDEMRIDLCAPKIGCIRINQREIWYHFYEMDSRLGAFLQFVTDGTLNFHSRVGEAAFVVFQNRQQRTDFEEYVRSNVHLLDRIPDDSGAQAVNERIERHGEYFIFDPVELVKLKTLFLKWRDEQ